MEEDHRIKISPKTVQHEQCGFCGKQADKADERITLYRVVPGKKYITAEIEITVFDSEDVISTSDTTTVEVQ